VDQLDVDMHQVVVELVDIGPLVMDQHLYKEVHCHFQI
jgi:hypothetical protein